MAYLVMAHRRCTGRFSLGSGLARTKGADRLAKINMNVVTPITGINSENITAGIPNRLALAGDTKAGSIFSLSFQNKRRYYFMGLRWIGPFPVNSMNQGVGTMKPETHFYAGDGHMSS